MVHFGPQRYSFSLNLKKVRDIFYPKRFIFFLLTIVIWTLQYNQFKRFSIENS